MTDQLDLKVSRKLQKIMNRVEQLVAKEICEELGIALVLFPWTREGESSRKAEYQYISNAPRAHMHGAMKALVQKWDAGGVDVPPHEKQ